MTILVTGKSGQVGFELQRALAPLSDVVALGRQACDLADPEAIRHAVQSTHPDIIVNAAAYTAVDKAETDSDQANAINAHALGILGEVAKRLGALVIHYSTDYVFDGALERPYTETDTPNPQSVYGRSKLAGEIALAQSGARHLVFRTSWVVGAHGGNFAKTILRLARERETLNVVADQWGAPTSAALIADVTATAISGYLQRDKLELLGIYHLAAAGETNWHQYAQHVVRKALKNGMELKLQPEAIRPITTAEYQLPAPRPANSRLNTEKLHNTLGIDLPDWQTALNPVLSKIFQQS